MSEHQFSGGLIRKLWPTEINKFRDHLLRLDNTSRRMRFAHAVSDKFVSDYAERMNEQGSIVYAFIEDGEVRAVAELKKLGDTWGQEAEAAFSVETDYQDRGVGSELMSRVIRAARNRGVLHLYMSCLSQNQKMQRIAKKHEADLHFEYGEVIGDIVPLDSNYFSIMSEVVEDRVGYLMCVLDVSRKRLQKAA
ncbi:MAG: GNAT family N-acetyltransferase [Alphaproteobacteria bacterium]|nr:GNAT family N-acetyltransferase [Alphaproteobacteria bacterium]